MLAGVTAIHLPCSLPPREGLQLLGPSLLPGCEERLRHWGAFSEPWSHLCFPRKQSKLPPGGLSPSTPPAREAARKASPHTAAKTWGRGGIPAGSFRTPPDTAAQPLPPVEKVPHQAPGGTQTPTPSERSGCQATSEGPGRVSGHEDTGNPDPCWEPKSCTSFAWLIRQQRPPAFREWQQYTPGLANSTAKAEGTAGTAGPC